MKKLIHRIRENSWPIGIALVIAAFVTLDGALIFTAFSDKTIAPEENYYDKAGALRRASLCLPAQLRGRLESRGRRRRGPRSLACPGALI